MSGLVVLPVLVPLVAAAAGLAAWRHPRVQAWCALAGAATLVPVALALLVVVARDGIQVEQLGSWRAPFGISFVADLFSALMVLVTAIIGLAVTVYARVDVDPRRQGLGYHPLTQVLIAGVCGAFLTGDIFNLYVWFEVMLIASFVLLALGGEPAQLEGAVKYVALNLISSVLFLAAVGLLYGMTGTLNLADLHDELAGRPASNVMTATALLFLVAFGIKAAVFPLFFWLPASYHTPPVAVSALFAGLLTKVGVYALIRVFTLLFTGDVGYTHEIILVIAGLTMITGVLGAASQDEIRRILSFHIVSQIGYMLMGLGLFSRLALAGSIFYIVHHIVVKTNLFLLSGVIQRLSGSFELKRAGGLWAAHPGLALLFLVPALSLAGVPPLSGFFAKLTLVQAGLLTGRHVIVAVALIVGLLTLYSMTKIWAEAFWKPRPEAAPPPGRRVPAALLAPIVALAALTLALGAWPVPLLAVSLQAADQLLDPAAYVRAVREARP